MKAGQLGNQVPPSALTTLAGATWRDTEKRSLLFPPTNNLASFLRKEKKKGNLQDEIQKHIIPQMFRAVG